MSKTRLAILSALVAFELALAQVPKLPEPVDGTYEKTFTHDISAVVPADLNGDGTLDFVSRSIHSGGTIRIEARLYNNSAPTAATWEFNTNADATNPANHRDLPMTAWDFDGDGDWEVYYHYLSSGVWRHRIVNGLTGATLVDAVYPTSWSNKKAMVAIAYVGGRPRIVCNIDLWEFCRVDMFTAWNGSSWSLASMSGWPYTNGGGEGVAHDMIRAADVDVNNSDDEVLAGNVVLNSNGTERFHTADLVPNNTGGNADQSIIGFFSASRPNKLVYITGDGTYDPLVPSIGYGNNVTAVWAATGELMWNFNMEEIFGEGNWEHWHSGYIRQTGNGAELLVIDKSTDNWALIDVSVGAILNSGNTNPPYCSGVKPIKWNCGETATCGDIFYDNTLDLRADVGADGCEEIFGLSGTKTLVITFNLGCTGCASRYDNRQYRQDVALAASGYSPFWLGAIEITGTTAENDPANDPIITNVAPTNIALNSAVITWDTHEGATSQVEYGLTTEYGSTTTLDAALVIAHAVTVSGLTNGETYHFRVRSKDVNNNETISTDYTFICDCGE